MKIKIAASAAALACSLGAVQLLAGPGPGPAAQGVASTAQALPFDAAAVARRLMLSFRQEGATYEARGPLLAVSVREGAATVRAPGHAAHASFWTRGVRRGGDRLDGAATTRRDERGRLEVQRGGVREHFENQPHGLEQSWTFETLPAGTGALAVDVGAEGELRGTSARGFHFASGLTYSHATWVDARGTRTSIEGRWTGDGITFEVPEATLRESHFPAVLDPLVSAEFDADAPVALPAASDQLTPAVAWSGTQYLLAWSTYDRFNSLLDVLAARLDASGNLVDPFGITVATGADSIDGVAVASDGSGFLVSWTETRAGTARVRASRISGAGAVLDPAPLTVTSASASTVSRPRAAFASPTYLVVWSDDRDLDLDVYGARVNPATGALPDGNGFSMTSMGSAETNPVVDSTGSGFLVAWEDYRSGGTSDVYATRVTTAATVQTTNGFLVSNAAGAKVELALAWNGGAHLLTWADFRSLARYEIYGALITTADAVLPNTSANLPLATSATGSRSTPSVAALGSSASGAPFFVTWVDGRNPTLDLYGTRVSDAGVVLDPSHLWLVDAGEAQGTPVVAASGPSAFVAWVDQRSVASARDIWGETVSAAGVIGPAAVKSLFANEEWEPAVAFGGSMYFVTWSDLRGSNGSYNPSAIYGARVSDAGVSLDPGAIVISNAALASPRTPDVTWVAQANQFVVTWTDDRDGGRNIYGARVTSTGTNLDPNGVVISSAASDQTEPAVTSDGTRALVTWSDKRNIANGTDVYATFFLPDGGVSPSAATGFAIVSTAAEQYQPAVAWNGSDYLVVWTDWRSIPNGNDVYASRVTAAGTVRDALGQPLTAAGNQTAAVVATVGSTFLVAYQDDRNVGAAGDIYASRVDPTGSSISLLDTSAGLAVATGSEIQSFPAAAGDGTNFLLTWQSAPATAGKPYTVRGTRISAASGSLLDGATGFVISPGSIEFGSQQPRVASGGPRTFLAATWTALMPPGAGMGGRVKTRLVTNTPPAATVVDGGTLEDQSTTISLAGTDADGDALTYTVQTAPLHGSLSGSPPTLTYTPAANYNGPDSFTFTANDGLATSTPGTAVLLVSPVNDAPVPLAQSVSTPEDTAVNITLSGTDVEGTPLTYSIVAPPGSGSFNGTTPPNLTFTPALNFSGIVTFTFSANDQTVTSPSAATVVVTVTAVNDAPVAQAQSVTATEDTAKVITLAATDVDSASLGYTVVSPPSNGTLSGTPPNLTYQPAANYAGTDSFSFKANDGTVDSNVSVVSISVVGVNDAPVATGANLGTNQDTALQITLQAADLETASLNYIIVSGPTHGTLSGTGALRNFTPTTGYVGLDSFTFKANDGVLDSNVATVSIDIGAVNHAPVATPQSVSTTEDTAKAITLAGTDSDNDPLTYTLLANPIHGTLSGAPPAVTYTPVANYAGGDSFTFRVSDGSLDSALAATVSITVSPVNDAPTATAQNVSVPEDSMLPLTLSGTDVDGDPLTYVVLSQPVHGTLSGTPPAITYTPTPNYAGLDAFTFKVNDGTVDSASAQFLINITQANDAPVAQPQSLSTLQDTPLNILLTGMDLDGNLLSFTILTQPTNGSLSGSPPNVIYTPRAGFRGNDSFTFKASDGLADSAPASVGISVNAVNHAPVATSQELTTDEDVVLPVTLVGTDQDGDPLTFQVVVQPTHGTVTLSGASLTYTPTANYNGVDTVQFRANDGFADSTDGTLRITVAPVDDPPTAQAQSVTTSEDTPVSIVLAGADPDGPQPTFTVVAMPAHGALLGNAPNLNYTPEQDFGGPDEFRFTVSDGTSTSAETTVTIVVSPVNDAPVVEPIQVSTVETAPVTVTLAGNDIEGSVLTFTVATEPTHGTVSGTGPNLTYTAETGYVGTDTFTYTANDGSATSLPGTVTVTVTASTGVTRDTTQVNGWSCGCSSSSGSGSAWLLGVGLLLLGSRRRRSLAAAVLCVPLLVATASQAAPPKAKTTKKAPPAPAPEAAPAPAPALPPVTEVAAPTPPPAPKGPPSLAALDVAISVPDEKLDGVAFTEMLTSAVDQSKLFRVISSREVATMLGLERQKALLGCTDDTSCLTEVADALGSEFVMQGTVGRVGNTYLITVRLIDSKRSRVVGRAANQTADPNLLLNLVWKTTQQALDAWGATLPADEAQRVAARPKVEPAAAVAPPTSKIGVVASAVGSYQPLAAAGTRTSVGGEVAATWRLGRFDLGAGVVISPTPGGRLFATFALLPGDNRVSAGVRLSGFPTATTYGGGPVVEYERALGPIFGLRAHVAGEAYGSPTGFVLALLGGVGAAARF